MLRVFSSSAQIGPIRENKPLYGCACTLGVEVGTSHFVRAQFNERASASRFFLASLFRQFVDFSPIEMICGLEFSIQARNPHNSGEQQHFIL